MNFFTTQLEVVKKNPKPRTEPEHKRCSVRKGGMERREEAGKGRRRVETTTNRMATFGF